MIWLKRAVLIIFATILWAALTTVFVSKMRLCNAFINSAADKAGITLCYNGRDHSPLGCSMKHITLLYGHSPIAKIKMADISLWKIKATGIRLEGATADMFPRNIEYVIFNPFSGRLHSRGDFGTLNGKLSWLSHTVTLELSPSSLMKRKFGSTLRIFKKRDGKYTYAISF